MKHDEAWHLLPWFVNGRLRAVEHDSVHAHLAACSECRAELETQQQISSAIAHEDSRQTSTQGAFDELWSRISEGAPAKRKAAYWRSAPAAVRWLAAAVIVEAVGLAALAAAHPPPEQSPGSALYRTLSSAPGAAGEGAVRVVFVPDLTLEGLQSLLRSSQLRVVDGPTEAGVYTLALTGAPASIDSVLAALRGTPFVRFAEPIGQRTPPAAQ